MAMGRQLLVVTLRMLMLQEGEEAAAGRRM